MSNWRFDDLWSSAAHDGASCPIGVSGDKPGPNAGSKVEVDLLMDAWFLERTNGIECSLILGQAEKLLTGLLAEGTVSPRKRREVCRIVRTIRRRLRDKPERT